ncbi:hypothetical protein ACOSP7_028421 [Xanthoceras sorbifolium]
MSILRTWIDHIIPVIALYGRVSNLAAYLTSRLGVIIPPTSSSLTTIIIVSISSSSTRETSFVIIITSANTTSSKISRYSRGIYLIYHIEVFNPLLMSHEHVLSFKK